MNNFSLIALLLILTSCSSNSVLMTSQEQRAFMNEHSQSFDASKSAGTDSIMRYVSCKSEKSCFEIECRGRGETTKCWKTPVSIDYAADRVAAATNPESLDSSHLKSACLSGKTNTSEKRQSCSSFLHIVRDLNEGKEALKILCDLDGVNCVKNGEKWGKGSITLGPRFKTTSLSLTIKNETTNLNEKFQVLYLKD